MKLPRSSSRYIVLFTLMCILFMQFALAGYACPGLKVLQSVEMAAMPADVVSMPGCESMDSEQPGLCHAYVHTGKQSLDKPEFPHVQPFIPAAFTQIFNRIVTAATTITMEPASLLLAHSTAPPLAIQNCCFRI